MKRDLPPVHPGEILLEDFLTPMGITRYRLAKEIGVPQRRIDEICAAKRAITADTALRLARYFGTDAQSWMNLQAGYDLEVGANRAGRAHRAGGQAFAQCRMRQKFQVSVSLSAFSCSI